MQATRYKEELVQYELIVYQMAMLLYSCESHAILVTKRVLCELWKDPAFFGLAPQKQRNRLIWLVSSAAEKELEHAMSTN